MRERFGADEIPSKTTIEDAVLASATKARNAVMLSVTSKSQSSAIITDAVCTKSKRFSQLHRAWRVTAAFWDSVCGSEFHAGVEQQIFQCLGTPEAPMIDVVTASQRLATLSKSKLMSFAGLSSQNVFSVVTALIDDFKSRHIPKFDSRHDSLSSWR